MIDVTFRLPGLAYSLLMESNFPADEPDAAADLRTAERVVKGKGAYYRVTTTIARAVDMADHLDSILGAVSSMTGEERGSRGGSEITACKTAIDRINMGVTRARLAS